MLLPRPFRLPALWLMLGATAAFVASKKGYYGIPIVLAWLGGPIALLVFLFMPKSAAQREFDEINRTS